MSPCIHIPLFNLSHSVNKLYKGPHSSFSKEEKQQQSAQNIQVFKCASQHLSCLIEEE